MWVVCLMYGLSASIEAKQSEHGKTETNNRLLGVAVHSYNHAGLDSIGDVNEIRLFSQLEEFFISYNKQRGKEFRVTGTGGPKKAIRFLKNRYSLELQEFPTTCIVPGAELLFRKSNS